MYNQEKYQKNLKQALSYLRDKTVYELLEHDRNYQSSVEQHSIKEDSYLKIQDTLLPEHKKIIDDYIDAIEANREAVNDLSYIAGLKDMLMFLTSYRLI